MFEYKEPATVVREMNALGAARVPFLFAFDYELQRALLVAHPLQQDEVLFSVRGVTNRKTVLNHPQIALEVFPMDYDRYSQGFDVIRRALMRGDWASARALSRNDLEAPAIELMGEIGQLIQKFEKLGA